MNGINWMHVAVRLAAEKSQASRSRGVVRFKNTYGVLGLFAPKAEEDRITQDLAAARIEVLGTGHSVGEEPHLVAMVVRTTDDGPLKAIVEQATRGDDK
jgi:hypothetical protein